MDDTVAIDATHFEARDQAPPKEENRKPAPKKRGRKSKEEREQWLKEQAEKEANLPLYEKKIEDSAGRIFEMSCAPKSLKTQNGGQKKQKGKTYSGLATKDI